MTAIPPFLEPHTLGVVLSVQARPGGSRNGITGIQGNALKVMVTQIPEKGKANRVLCEVLAEGLGVRKSQIELLAGETSSRKKFLIREVTYEAVCEVLRQRGLHW